MYLGMHSSASIGGSAHEAGCVVELGRTCDKDGKGTVKRVVV
jgi:hypothetical protein